MFYNNENEIFFNIAIMIIRFSFEFDVKYDICVIHPLMFLVFCLLTSKTQNTF